MKRMKSNREMDGSAKKNPGQKQKRGSGIFWKIWMAMGVLLCAAALLLAGYSFWGEYQATKNADAALGQVEQLIAAEPVDERESQTDNEEPKIEKEEASEASEELEMTVKMVNGQEYIGVVEIPTLSLKLPVISEWSDDRLKIAPCRYIGSVYTHDLIISGHSYKNHFRYIRKLELGDPVTFTDMDGQRFEYEVCGTEVIDTHGVEEMEVGKAEDWDLTLFTCTSTGSARHTVRCRLVAADNLQVDETEEPTLDGTISEETRQ